MCHEEMNVKNCILGLFFIYRSDHINFPKLILSFFVTLYMNNS